MGQPGKPGFLVANCAASLPHFQSCLPGVQKSRIHFIQPRDHPFLQHSFAVDLLLQHDAGDAGGDIFGYSLAEITQTVGASGTLAIVPVMIFLVFISLVIAGILFIRKRIFFPPVIGLLVPVLSAAYIFVGWDENVQPKLETDFETKLAENKSEHFYNAAYRHFEPEIYETDIYAESYVKNYLAGDDVLEPVEYVDEFNYPFLRKSTGHDVLGPYFETKQKKAKSRIYFSGRSGPRVHQ